MENQKYESEYFSENSKEEMIEKDTSDSIGEAFNENVRPLIDLIDNLRRIGLQQYIDLPNIVIVGDQSSGKSSIIEAISGIELPRGKGIVTRCPLELQLKQRKDKPWEATLSYKKTDGEFEKISIKDPRLVEESIIKAQEIICKTKFEVSSELITLRVESPASTAPDLTLIDLPGIARIAVEGQKWNICEQLHDIIMDHIKNKNTVILCVVSANLDAAVNESIKLAQKVDPKGRRTLGVITKPDTADDNQKEEVLNLLNNEKIKLLKGFHMVKCRSQKELNEKLSLEKSLKNEREFFQTDKVYRDAAEDQLGIMNLARKITKELFKVIKTNLPALQENVDNLLNDSKTSLNELGLGIPDTLQGKMCYLTEKISRMNQEIELSLIHGERKHNKMNLFYSWRNLFKTMKWTMESIKQTDMNNNFGTKQLENRIMETRGNEISGFLKFQLFEEIIREHVIKYKAEAVNLLTLMKKDTNKIVTEIIESHFSIIPIMESELKQIACSQIELSANITMGRINEIFKEESLVFTQDEAFDEQMELLKAEKKEINNCFSFSSKVKITPIQQNYFVSDPNHIKNTEVSQTAFEKTLSENAKRMQDIIRCYLKIVNSRLSDSIPLSIRQQLHVELNRILREKSVEYITTPGNAMKATENKSIRDKRKNLKGKVNRLEQAQIELMKL